MSFEKKMLIVKIAIIAGVIIVSGYLWFYKEPNYNFIYNYSEGSIIVDEKPVYTYEEDTPILFEYYLKDKDVDLDPNSPNYLLNIDENGKENYYGAIYTELMIYFSDEEYKIYLMTEKSVDYVTGCYSKDSYCIFEHDKFLALSGKKIEDVTDKVMYYYKSIAKKIVDNETEVFQAILKHLDKDTKGEFAFGTLNTVDNYTTINKEYLTFIWDDDTTKNSPYDKKTKSWYVSYREKGQNSKNVRYFKVNDDLKVEELTIDKLPFKWD